ncbi:hypothetical protein ACOME3_009996 [Neoechinorhynchus agilis]
MWNLKTRSRSTNEISEVNVKSNDRILMSNSYSDDSFYVYVPGKLIVIDSAESSSKICRNDVVTLSKTLEFDDVVMICENGDFVQYSSTKHFEGNVIRNIIKDFYQSFCDKTEFLIEECEFSHEKDICALIVSKGGNTRRQKFIILCYGNGTSMDVDPIEFGLESNKCSVQSVNVGWGHKLTQFHGSLGKTAAKTKNAEMIVDWSVDSTLIRWRYDDEYFAINGLDSNGTRKLFVYDRNGILYSRTDQIFNMSLSTSMCWKPDGEHLACGIKESGEWFIGFFEKNGLEHGERLKLDTYAEAISSVNNLSYSLSGDLLVICIDHRKEESGDLFKLILLFQRTNYSWFCKQHCFEWADGHLVFAFDDKNPLACHISALSSSNNQLFYVRTEYQMVYDTSDDMQRQVGVDKCS